MLKIKTKNLEIATAKKSKKHLTEISKKIRREDLSFVEKKEKLNEEMFFFIITQLKKRRGKFN